MTHNIVLSLRPDEVKSLVDQMIGYQLITQQTGAAGRPCNKVLLLQVLYYTL